MPGCEQEISLGMGQIPALDRIRHHLRPNLHETLGDTRAGSVSWYGSGSVVRTAASTSDLSLLHSPIQVTKLNSAGEHRHGYHVSWARRPEQVTKLNTSW